MLEFLLIILNLPPIKIMVSVTLPDGSQRDYPESLSAYEVAKSIGEGLARAAVACKIDGVLKDLSEIVANDVAITFLTSKDEEGLEVIRHSSAHLLAQAVKRLFPSAQVTIGPVIEDGFYYDFAYERSFTPDDLIAIEKEMQKIIKEALPVTRKVLSREDAIQFFKKLSEHYKAEIISDLPAGEELSLYSQGEFTDLCRGPHIPSTDKVKAVKLTKLAGAYWRGDNTKPMLQRVYGTAWASKDELNDYLKRLEEAEKRDHRKLAKQLDFFHLQEEAPGMVFWHDAGWTLYRTIENYIRSKLQQHDYQEVKTPSVVDRSLWERSGHWEKFSQMMFTTSSENREYAVKPMNCPCHVQIYKEGLKSYRDLPLRMAEFGSCHRNEPSGTLHGIMRVRGFVQDDAHIFCTESQIQDEVMAFTELLYEVYREFGFEDVIVKLATRPENRVSSDEVWDVSEKALEQALNAMGLKWELSPGEGAFYGPKIEFSLRDCLKRVWQCGTMQVDLSMPGRLGATYIAEDGSKKTPVMLHRAILGSLERFIGILIEHHAGLFPIWLAPIQMVVMNITDNQAEYASEISQKLLKMGVRVQKDLRNEKIGFKIREQTLRKVPILLVVGDKEVADKTVAVRHISGDDWGTMGVPALVALFQQKVEGRL